MSEFSKKSQSTSNRFLSAKEIVGKFISEIWKDLQDKQRWKYEQLAPVQLLAKSEPCRTPPGDDELARANWFWSRRPRLLQAATFICWLTVIFGLPFWLLIFPAIGVPLIIGAAVIGNTEIVRSVRWRREYELSIDRLVRTCRNGRDTFGVDICM